MIIARVKEGEVNGFHNVCKHRGNELVQDDFGKGATSFTCIMHSWRYNMAGKNVRLLQRFRPHPTDPEKGYNDVIVLSAKVGEGCRPPAYMGVEDHVDLSGKVRPQRRRTTHHDPQGGEVVEQGIANMVTLQRGMHSKRLHDTIVFSEQEKRIQQFLAEKDLYLGDRKPRKTSQRDDG